MEKKIISRKYEIQSEIARGGMGVVYKALHNQLNRVVAIKVLHDQFSGDSSFLSRFHREARAMARLDHENIIRVFDVADDGDKEQYIVMEYFPGKDLKQIIREKGKMKIGEVVSISIQVSKAVAYAHAHGLIHRDIKPANVMMNDQGVVKLADFGIAAANDEASVTSTGQVIGTPEYMSPEQAKGETLDGRSDLYSIGMVIYEMLHGATPFAGVSKMAIVSDLYSNPAEHKLEFTPEIPLELQEIVRSLVRKNVGERIADPELLISGLARIQEEWGSAPGKEEESSIDERTVLLSSKSSQKGGSTTGKFATSTSGPVKYSGAKTQSATSGSFKPVSSPPSSGINDKLRQIPGWATAVAGGLLLFLVIGIAFYFFTKKESSAVVRNEPVKQVPAPPPVPEKPTVMEEVRNLQGSIRDLMGKVSSAQADADRVNAKKLASKEYQEAVDANHQGEEALKGAQSKIDQSQFEAAQPLLSDTVNQLKRANDKFAEAAKTAGDKNEKQAKMEAEKQKKEKKEKDKKLAKNVSAPSPPPSPPPTASKGGNSSQAKTTSASANVSQREIDEATVLLNRFVRAYESKDMNAIQKMSDVTENKAQFFKKIFSEFNKIKMSVSRSTVNTDGLKADLTIESLESKTGDMVTPGKNWKSFQVIIPRENGRWERMIIR